MDRAIVTGGAGFIGSHLVDELLKRDFQVLVLDNLVTGDLRNLAAHFDDERLICIKRDIAEYNRIKHLFPGISWVFHLAGLASIVPSIQNPIDYYKANALGTASVLEASRKVGVERFIYAASSSCYGIPDAYPTSEYQPIKPMHPYALTKYLGEQSVLHWGEVYDLPVVSLRLFNVYGPRSRTTTTYGAVFGVFLAQKLANKPFTVVGDGNQSRDFTFVSDVVDAFICAAESSVKNEVFNVGSGNHYTINRLVELLGGGEVVHLPKRLGEPDKTLAYISKIQKTLGWSPKVSFEEGVKILLQNIDYWKDAPVWDEKSIGEATKEWFNYFK